MDILKFYVISGSQRIEVNDQTYDLHEGDATMIFPDMVHRYEITGNFVSSPSDSR
ncbi:AraC family ligand binding domain-containing protein [Priestia sp. FSL H7-0729]